MTNINRRSMLAAISLGGLAGLVPAAQAKPQAAAATELKGAEYFDVVVAGGGAVGCMAARTASRAGKKVLLVQAVPMLGGSSAISSGWIRACGTEWHKARGIKDTTEAYKADIIAYGRAQPQHRHGLPDIRSDAEHLLQFRAAFERWHHRERKGTPLHERIRDLHADQH